MKAIIMAGGEGTRLRPLTSNRPKPMIPIINKPVIEHTVSLLRKQKIYDITISLFFRPENVQNYFGDGSDWDVNISYSVEETPLGTAGGVKLAAKDYNSTIIVLSGDGVIDFNITEIVEFHREKKSMFTIVLTRVNQPTEYGIVITKENGEIDKFLEKPAWSEVFSDTVNTGMYIIEPQIIEKYIPENQKFDFSMDLFPLLQAEKISLFGFIADGYWCDVGNLNAYREVHQAILDGLVKIDFPGKKIGDNIWVGKNVEIDPEAKIEGPVILGNFVRVKRGAEISEFSVIGDSCVIEEDASVRRSIILHNTIVGPKSEIRGAIIGKRCVIEENVSIYEGAVVSDDCDIGSNSEIPPGIKVWPEKIIEQGTKLTTDLIWGKTEYKVLFSTDGIVGSFNVKINPEFAAKLGSAIGAFLGKNSIAIISRDVTPSARLIKRALTAGLLSMGVDVFDMEIESIPLTRYSTRFNNADMSIYIQMSPMTGLQFIQIKIFNRFGFSISIAEEKKIESIFFRGDYPRKDAFEVGRLLYPIHHKNSYLHNIKKYVDHILLKEKKWNIIADCFYGSTAYILPDLLAEYGCIVTLLRGQVKETVNEVELKEETRKAIENITTMSRANKEIGVIIGPHGEHINIIDEMGNILSEEEIIALLCIYYLKYKDEKIINIPVTSSTIFEQLAETYEATIIRTSTKIRSPEDAEDIFLPDELGRYPYLELDYDPMIVFLRILEFATLENIPLHDLIESIPKSNMHSTVITCTIDEKASIMRYLTDLQTDDNSKIEMIDGVRIVRDDAWILILPDAIHPHIHLYAEGTSIESRDSILEEFTTLIKKFRLTSG